jgi:hypothetical protein
LRSLTGVVGVSNSIALKSSIAPVTLRGEVDSLAERAAELS